MCYLPEQHSQQKEDEDPDEQADGDDPSHHITPGLLTVKSLKQQLEHNTAPVNTHIYNTTQHNTDQSLS